MTVRDKRQSRPPAKAKLTRVKTVSDLLTRDDVNGILADLNADKSKINDLIVIYTDRVTGDFNWQVTNNTLESLAVWLLEKMKADIVNAGLEDR